MENAAKKFEQEDGVLETIKSQAKNLDDLYSYSSTFLHGYEDSGYFPYCEIEFESETTKDFLERQEISYPPEPTNHGMKATTGPEVSESMLTCVASALCSFADSIEGSGMSDSVSWFSDC